MKKSFLESEIGKMKSEDSFFHIIPAPLEKSVSYGGGTALAYDAIVEASQQLELYDGKSSPSELGIFCGTPVECETDVETVIHRIENAVSETFDIHAFPILVGGE
ncbi:MAG: arginase family protein, partial [Spirochaetota bacterium]